MKIEKLLPPVRPGKPWTVSLEGGSVLSVPEAVVAQYALYTGMELEEDQLTAVEEGAKMAALREKAVSLLTGRLLSEGQLREKLRNRGATPRQAEEVAAWAREIGLLNDEAYAKALVRHGQDKGYGLYKIKEMLYRRQVPRQYWEEALAELEAPDEWIDRYLAEKVRDPEDPRQIRKASDALVRRGFSWHQVSDGISRLRREWEP